MRDHTAPGPAPQRARWKRPLWIALLMLVVFAASTAQGQNLLRNPSFETIPAPMAGQGFVPSEWIVVSPSPDTYSDDGSYGLAPSGFANFTGVTAFDGIRWVAGWEAANERFGQTLSTPLVAGSTYRLQGFLHQAVRSDLNHPGGYEIELAEAGQASGTFVVATGVTTGAGWEPFVVTFVAPADSATRPLLIFSPISEPVGAGAYPGVDDLSLTLVASAVPGLGPPAIVFLIGFGLVISTWSLRSPEHD